MPENSLKIRYPTTKLTLPHLWDRVMKLFLTIRVRFIFLKCLYYAYGQQVTLLFL